jgi:hypothetical protein
LGCGLEWRGSGCGEVQREVVEVLDILPCQPCEGGWVQLDALKSRTAIHACDGVLDFAVEVTVRGRAVLCLVAYFFCRSAGRES